VSIPISLSASFPIESVDDLRTRVKAEANRSDLTDDEINEFIQRAESRFNRILRVPAMEAVSTGALVDGAAAEPSDFLQLRAMYDANNCAIPAVDPVQWIETRYGAKVHCRISGALRVAPATDEAVTIIYYAKIPALSAEQSTNWLLTSHPDVYLYEVMLQVCSRIGDDDNAIKWRAASDEALAELSADGLRSRFGGPLRQRGVATQVRGARI
jgi:hypothetical protein